MLRTLRECEWSEIEIGEVFAADGCIDIWYKVNKNKARYLAGDHRDDWGRIDMSNFYGRNSRVGDINFCGSWHGDIYKLPESAQRLWKTE